MSPPIEVPSGGPSRPGPACAAALLCCLSASGPSARSCDSFLLADGDLDGVQVGSAPDRGSAAGAWAFPPNDISPGMCEQAPEQVTVLGSAGGTSPPLPIDGVVLEIADAYFRFTLGNPSTPPHSSSLGLLDAAGSASAAFTLPAGLAPSFPGLQLHHAFLVIDLVEPNGAVHASNPLPVTLL